MSVLSVMRRQFSQLGMKCVISGYREYCNAGVQHRALISYLAYPLLPPPRLREHIMFSNRGIAQEIPRALNELGYEVDIVDYRNKSWVPQRNYDLFIGHGGHNFIHIQDNLPSSTPAIYFATGLYWREQNLRAARRLLQIVERRGYLLPPERVNGGDEESANRCANAIVCFGNRETARSFASFPHVFTINNAAYPVTLPKDYLTRKDYDRGRTRFFFFSGSGNVHKGLDLLLEAFSNMDFDLYICQDIRPEFARAFQREIGRPNIHVLGYVKMRSQEFLSLAESCNWVILPTCAEGQPGSVLEAMAYGLIPILPASANIDLEDWGLEISDLSVEAVSEAIYRAVDLTESECRRRASAAMAAVQMKYSVGSFRRNFQEAVKSILQLTAS